MRERESKVVVLYIEEHSVAARPSAPLGKWGVSLDSAPSGRYLKIRSPFASDMSLAGEPVKLTAQEYKLLSYLMHHKGKVVSRTELIEHIYDQDFDRDSNTIEVFVTRIRKKLGQDVITTIRGLGYSLEDPEG